VDGDVQRRIDLPAAQALEPRSIVGLASDPVHGNLLPMSEVRVGYVALVAVDPTTGTVFDAARLEYGQHGERGHMVVRGGSATWE
jgi:hypothetical protein